MESGSDEDVRKGRVSDAVIRRLPLYFRHLTDLELAGVERISSSALGQSMNLAASQIRQDLSCFGEFGQQGYGYKVENLRREIADILGMHQGHTAVILGAGNLGRALIENFHFERSGFTLQAAFDVCPEVVGTRIAGLTVRHANTLEEYLAAEPCDVGVLTVPRSAAQGMADRLIASGVKGLWNFTNMELQHVAGDVLVENVHFADSLLTLSYLISEGV